MGGEEYGELASLTAVSVLGDFSRDFDARADEYIRRANEIICDAIEKNGGMRIGTTMAVLSVSGRTARAYNIGDSRIYFMRDGVLRQISLDHTQVQRLINQGIITPEKAKTHPERHKLTQHLGIFPEEMIIEAYKAEPIEVQPGDIFLLCSDGLTDMVEDADIAAILAACGSPEEKSSALIAAALNNGGRDNVTALVVNAVRYEQYMDDGRAGAPKEAPEEAPQESPKSRNIPEKDAKPAARDEDKAPEKQKSFLQKVKDWLNEDAFVL
jgi:serine/threonine protein phosphatase PrpC